MFNLEDFKHNDTIYRIVEKLNKHLEKSKITKITSILENLNDLLSQNELVLPTTYILSIIAEEHPELISGNLLKKIEELAQSDKPNIKLNSIITLGFKMLSTKELIEEYLPNFFQSLLEQNNDINENIYFFLQKLFETDPSLICGYKEKILENLKQEKSKDNIISLLNYLDQCKDYSFEELYDLKEIIRHNLKLQSNQKDSILFKKIKAFTISIFPSLNQDELWEQDLDSLLKRFDQHIIAKRYKFSEINQKTGISFKDFIEGIKDSHSLNKKIYFYVKQTKESNEINIYEIEKEKLINAFQKNDKVSKKELIELLGEFVDSETELRLMIETLIKLRYINGYYSLLGFFYPNNFIISEFLSKIQSNGILNTNKFDYLPEDFIKKIIKEIEHSVKIELLKGKDEKSYYSLKKIKEQINTEAAKLNSIDLKAYRDRLSDSDFIKLIKNLPKDFLTSYHHGTQWLTNLGLMNIKKEIENSKILGYFSIDEVSNKLKVNKILLLENFNLNIDSRIGLYDNSGEIFYYSKFINQKIDTIRTISDSELREVEINRLAKELNIEKQRILSKIDENLRSIGKEIKNLDEIKVKEYLEKTGMQDQQFMSFIDDLGIPYFKKGGRLIFNKLKIEDVKKNVKLMLINKLKLEDHIDLEGFEITPKLIQDLLKEVVIDNNIKGIFHINDEHKLFYSDRGIKNLMLENRTMFSFDDFFFGKDLNEEEITIMHSILKELLETQQIKGTFNDETLTFFSSEVVFAQDYNIVLDEFEKMVDKYLEMFNTEFQKIKKILIKENQTIFPQEIKIIQGTIDNINQKYVLWRSGIEAFIKNANINLLKKQGFTFKRYKTMKMSSMSKIDVKLFEEDVQVVDKVTKFNDWVKLFNNLEIKYGNVIFYQKRLLQDPTDKSNLERLNVLFDELQLK